MTSKHALALLLISATTLASGCGAGGGTSIPKSLLGHHNPPNSSASVSVSSAPEEAVETRSETPLVVDDTQFFSNTRTRGTTSLDRAQRIVTARAASPAASIVINDRAILSDLSSLGSEIIIERQEGFSMDPESDEEAHVTVLVELNRSADNIPERAVLPQAQVTIARDAATGAESVVLSFTGVDPTAELMVNSMLRDMSRVLIIRSDR